MQRYGCCEIGGGTTADVHVYIVTTKPLGFLFILGMNSILTLGGVTVNGQHEASLRVEGTVLYAVASSVTTIEERDFSLSCDPVTNAWVAPNRSSFRTR